MCVNLRHSHEEDPTPLPTQDSLSGTLVSSLHRLKDVDNLDGGFFVFGDLSVKVEGEYRLQFSLFEMLKTEVVFIKSTVSSPFRAFPGMSESTFLSRSFGDQGVRLRIRKEPRSLLKRPASISARSEDFASSVEDTASNSTQRDMTVQSQRPQVGTYGVQYTREAEPSQKRQRTSVDYSARDVYDPDRHHGRPYFDQRAALGGYTVRDQTANSFNPIYGQASQSALGNVPDYTFGHQRTNSSSTSSPYTSPHTEVSGQSWPATNIYFQPTFKDSMYNYPTTQYPDMQLNRQPQMMDALTRYRGQTTLAHRLPGNHNSPFPRSQDPDNSATGNYNSMGRSVPLSSSFDESSLRLPSTDQLDMTSSNRQQYPSTTLSNVLPPLESTLSSTRTQQVLPSHIMPSIETQDLEPVPSQSTQERASESYDPTGFGFSLPEPKRLGEG
ncbi:MAG: hypothetical protein Q9178_000554 [Gyalolechia marmorata]